MLTKINATDFSIILKVLANGDTVFFQPKTRGNIYPVSAVSIQYPQHYQISYYDKITKETISKTLNPWNTNAIFYVDTDIEETRLELNLRILESIFQDFELLDRGLVRIEEYPNKTVVKIEIILDNIISITFNDGTHLDREIEQLNLIIDEPTEEEEEEW